MFSLKLSPEVASSPMTVNKIKAFEFRSAEIAFFLSTVSETMPR